MHGADVHCQQVRLPPRCRADLGSFPNASPNQSENGRRTRGGLDAVTATTQPWDQDRPAAPVHVKIARNTPEGMNGRCVKRTIFVESDKEGKQVGRDITMEGQRRPKGRPGTSVC